MPDPEVSFSVVVAVRNGARYLERCIRSVIAQTWPSKELIVIDGGSTDGTQDIIKSFPDSIAYWESQADRGIYHAWNKALRHVGGSSVYFLGADDYLWSPEVLKQLSPHLMKAYPPFRVVYGRVSSVTERGELIVLEGMPWERARTRILEEMTIPHQGVMHHRSLFEIHGDFDDSFRIAGDYDLLLRELTHSGALYVPEIVVAGMQVGGYSTTPAFAMQTLREFRRAQRKHGIRHPSLGWTWAYLKAWSKHGLSRILGERITRALANVYRVLSGRPPRRMRF